MGFFQARILEWIAMPSSRGSSWPRERTCVFCTASRFFTTEPPGKALGIWWAKLKYQLHTQRNEKASHFSTWGLQKGLLHTCTTWAVFKAPHLLSRDQRQILDIKQMQTELENKSEFPPPDVKLFNFSVLKIFSPLYTIYTCSLPIFKVVIGHFLVMIDENFYVRRKIPCLMNYWAQYFKHG